MRVVDVGGSYQANFADDKKTTVIGNHLTQAASCVEGEA